MLADAAYFADDEVGLREHMAKADLDPQLHPKQEPGAQGRSAVPLKVEIMFYLVKSGFLNEIDADLKRLETAALIDQDRWRLQLVRGCLSLVRGDPDRAIELIIAARARLLPGDMPWSEECLVDAMLRRGQMREAIAVLQRWESVEFPLPVPFPFRTRHQLRLAELYHADGRDEPARRLANHLTNILSQAEPDFPLLGRLRQLQQALGSAK